MNSVTKSVLVQCLLIFLERVTCYLPYDNISVISCIFGFLFLLKLFVFGYKQLDRFYLINQGENVPPPLMSFDSGVFPAEIVREVCLYVIVMFRSPNTCVSFCSTSSYAKFCGYWRSFIELQDS